MKVKSISDRRPNEYYSKEYFVTVKYQVTDLNNPKRKFGVIVSGMGSKPISSLPYHIPTLQVDLWLSPL